MSEYDLLAPIDGILHTSDRHAILLGKGLERHAIDHMLLQQFTIAFSVPVVDDPFINDGFEF